MSYEEERFKKKHAKEERQRKKEAQNRDRSKYKESNQKQHNEDVSDPSAPYATITSTHAEGFLALHGKNSLFLTLRGTLKQEKRREKNLVAVGDRVTFSLEKENEGSIKHVLPRKTALIRTDLVRKKKQILVANVDQVLLVTSCCTPPLKEKVLDRYIVSCLQGGITPCIAINKTDLLAKDPEENNRFLALCDAYAKTSIQVVTLSCLTDENLAPIEELLANKTTALCGQSGVGKTTLLNKLLSKTLPTSPTSEKTKKGRHTTTRASLLPLEKGGFLIDTPGVKSFGIWEKEKLALDQYFEEIFRYKERCAFVDCTHSHEEGCFVKQAVQEGLISPLRYQSYLDLLQKTH